MLPSRWNSKHFSVPLEELLACFAECFPVTHSFTKLVPVKPGDFLYSQTSHGSHLWKGAEALFQSQPPAASAVLDDSHFSLLFPCSLPDVAAQRKSWKLNRTCDLIARTTKEGRGGQAGRFGCGGRAQGCRGLRQGGKGLGFSRSRELSREVLICLNSRHYLCAALSLGL